jgi:hypothetical protein
MIIKDHIKIWYDLMLRLFALGIREAAHRESGTLGDRASPNKHRAERHRRMPLHLSLELSRRIHS